MTYILKQGHEPQFTNKAGKPCSLANIIKRELKSKGWSVDDLADETKVNRVTIYRLLSGTQDMSSSKLFKILRALGLKVIIKK